MQTATGGGGAEKPRVHQVQVAQCPDGRADAESNFWTCVSLAHATSCADGPWLENMGNQPKTIPYCHQLGVTVPGNKVQETMKKVSLSATHCLSSYWDYSWSFSCCTLTTSRWKALRTHTQYCLWDCTNSSIWLIQLPLNQALGGGGSGGKVGTNSQWPSSFLFWVLDWEDSVTISVRGLGPFIERAQGPLQNEADDSELRWSAVLWFILVIFSLPLKSLLDLPTSANCWLLPYSISILLPSICDWFADKSCWHPISDVCTWPQPRLLVWLYKQPWEGERLAPAPLSSLSLCSAAYVPRHPAVKQQVPALLPACAFPSWGDPDPHVRTPRHGEPRAGTLLGAAVGGTDPLCRKGAPTPALELWGGTQGGGWPPPCPQRSHTGPGMGQKEGQVLWVGVQKRGRSTKSVREDGTHRDRQTQERIVPGAKGDFRSSDTAFESNRLFGLYVVLSILVN